MDQWGSFLFDVASWTLGLIAIFEGARRTAAGRRDKATIALIVGGIAWCALKGGATLYVAESLDSLTAIERHRSIDELRDDWGKQLTPEEREKASLAYAAVAYTAAGKLITYFDHSGERKEFVPSRAQLRERESTLVVWHRLDDASRNGYTTGLRWLLSAMFALVAGFIVGRRARRMAKDG